MIPSSDEIENGFGQMVQRVPGRDHAFGFSQCDKRTAWNKWSLPLQDA